MASAADRPPLHPSARPAAGRPGNTPRREVRPEWIGKYCGTYQRYFFYDQSQAQPESSWAVPSHVQQWIGGPRDSVAAQPPSPLEQSPALSASARKPSRTRQEENGHGASECAVFAVSGLEKSGVWSRNADHWSDQQKAASKVATRKAIEDHKINGNPLLPPQRSPPETPAEQARRNADWAAFSRAAVDRDLADGERMFRDLRVTRMNAHMHRSRINVAIRDLVDTARWTKEEGVRGNMRADQLIHHAEACNPLRSTRICPNHHVMTEFETQGDRRRVMCGVVCNSTLCHKCDGTNPAATTMYGCYQCGYYEGLCCAGFAVHDHVRYANKPADGEELVWYSGVVTEMSEGRPKMPARTDSIHTAFWDKVQHIVQPAQIRRSGRR